MARVVQAGALRVSSCSDELHDDFNHVTEDDCSVKQRLHIVVREQARPWACVMPCCLRSSTALCSYRTVGACLRSWHQLADRQGVIMIRHGLQALHESMAARAVKSAFHCWRQTICTQLALAVVHNQGRIKVLMFRAWLQRVRLERDLSADRRAQAVRRVVSAALTGWREHTQRKAAVLEAAEAHRSHGRLLSCLKAWREYRRLQQKCRALSTAALGRRANTGKSKALSAWKQHMSALKTQGSEVSTDPASFYLVKLLQSMNHLHLQRLQYSTLHYTAGVGISG